MGRRAGDQLADQFIALRPAEERDRGIVLHFARQFAASSASRYREDSRRSDRKRLRPRSSRSLCEKLNPLREPERARHFRAPARALPAKDRPQTDSASGKRAASETRSRRCRCRHRGCGASRAERQVADVFHQLLRFGPRNQGAPVAEESVLAELDRAEQMLQRLALAAPPHQLAQRRQLRLGERPVELEIKLDPFLA